MRHIPPPVSVGQYFDLQLCMNGAAFLWCVLALCSIQIFLLFGSLCGKEKIVAVSKGEKLAPMFSYDLNNALNRTP